MSALPEPEEGAVTDESLIVHQGNSALRNRTPYYIIRRRVRRTKTEAIPLPTFTFWGESESHEVQEVDSEHIDVIIHLKKKTAP